MQKKGNSVTRWTGYAGLAAGILLTLFLFQSIDLERSLYRISTIGFSSLFIMLPFFGLHFFVNHCLDACVSARYRADFIRPAV